MKLYYAPQTRSLRPRWMLEELEVPYELVRPDPSKQELRSAAYLENVQPLGRVPALEDGEHTMFESAAIVAYLADKYADKGLAPSLSSPLRAPYHQWMYFAVAELEPPIFSRFLHTVRMPEEKRIPEVAARSADTYLAAAKALDQRLGDRPFLVGDSFSAADLLVTTMISWAGIIGINKDLPRLDAYAKRHRQRPAFRRAIAD